MLQFVVNFFDIFVSSIKFRKKKSKFFSLCIAYVLCYKERAWEGLHVYFFPCIRKKKLAIICIKARYIQRAWEGIHVYFYFYV